MTDVVIDEVLDLGLVRNTLEEVDEDTIDLITVIVMIFNGQMIQTDLAN